MSRKKLLLYANYYHPEVAALAQLYTDLCRGLRDEFDVTVICAVPCYAGSIPAEYASGSFFFEEYDGVKVIRVRVPAVNKRSKANRIRHILAYFFRAVWATFKAPRADYVMAGSQPPILGGLLGVVGKWIGIARGKRPKLIYNIQDYNPEQTQVVGYCRRKLVLRAMLMLDKFSCSAADKVIVVGRDMVDTMKKRYAHRDGSLSRRMPETVVIHNWMDERTVYPLPKDDSGVAAFRKKYGLADKRVIMYSGNIGLFYDLDMLIRVIGRFRSDARLVFAFVGDGAKKQDLVDYVRTHGLSNVVFIPYQPKEKLIFSLNAADIHWVVSAKGIKGVSCPSKLYGVLAAAKPVLGVLEEGSEAGDVIRETNCGLVAPPGDADAITRMVERFAGMSDEDLAAAGLRGHACLQRRFTREQAIEQYRRALRSC